MQQTQAIEPQQAALPQELLTSFAKYLANDIISFYRSEEGKAYYAEWLKNHPEYQ